MRSGIFSVAEIRCFERKAFFEPKRTKASRISLMFQGSRVSAQTPGVVQSQIWYIREGASSRALGQLMKIVSVTAWASSSRLSLSPLLISQARALSMIFAHKDHSPLEKRNKNPQNPVLYHPPSNKKDEQTDMTRHDNGQAS